MNEQDAYYLEYQLANDQRVIMKFSNINDRDGCHISLDMYKVQLGPVDEAVLERIAAKFGAQILTTDS